MRVECLNSRNMDFKYCSEMVDLYFRDNMVTSVFVSKNKMFPSILYVLPNRTLDVINKEGYDNELGLRVDKLTYNTEKHFIEYLENNYNVNIGYVENKEAFINSINSKRTNIYTNNIRGLDVNDRDSSFYDGIEEREVFSLGAKIKLVIYFVVIGLILFGCIL